MSGREHVSLGLRLGITAAACWTLFLLGGYFFHYRAVRRHHLESAWIIIAAFALALGLVRRTPDEPDVAIAWPPAWLVWVAMFAAAITLYWPAVRLGLLSDDFVLLERARQAEFVSRTHEFVRPVPLIIWRLVWLCGGGPTALHATNVALHAVNAGLTVSLGRALGLGPNAAVLAGLLFVMWPTQVESIAWASGVFDALMTTFVLATATVYLTWNHGPLASWRRPCLVVLSALALGTKETAAALPALLAAATLPRWLLSRRVSRESLADLLLIAVCCAAYAVWRIFLRDAAVDTTYPQATTYVAKELVSRTFASLGLPFTVEWMQRWVSPVALFSALITLLTIAPSVLHTSPARLSTAAAAVLWSCLAAAPAVGYLFIGAHLEGSRYLYLPMAGWALFLSISATLIMQRQAHRWPALVAGLLALGMVTAQSRTLLGDWEHAAAMRDTLLREALRSVSANDCSTAHFSGLPARHRGAQLFTNGFDQAVAGQVRAAPGARPGGARCRFRWTGIEFVSRVP